MINQTASAPSTTANQNLGPQSTPDCTGQVWELGTYPNGTWFSSWRLNDLGVIVGRGDVPAPDGTLSNHTLAVPLFGPHAGEWIDLNPLDGQQLSGWEEPNNDISNTGLVASYAIAPDGQPHAVAWTTATDPIDLGTLADTGSPRFASHNSSMAIGTKKLGTLIVGGSGVNGNTDAGFDVPVVWTLRKAWMNGAFVSKWKIQKLDTTGFSGFRWVVWGVNDHEQIIGVGGNSTGTIIIGALWNPRPDGKGWKLMRCTVGSSIHGTLWHQRKRGDCGRCHVGRLEHHPSRALEARQQRKEPILSGDPPFST
jgi:hypothetical protein